MDVFANESTLLEDLRPIVVTGRISKVVGMVAECQDFNVPVGAGCVVESAEGCMRCEAEVIGFNESRTLLMPYGETQGLSRGDRVRCVARSRTVRVGRGLLGRVLDGMGRPIDGKGPILAEQERPLSAVAPHPLQRQRVTEPLSTGIRVIDALTTIGKGQRMGIFSGSGVGKSTLIGMIARYTNAAVNVIALVGERGREVREFLEEDLGPEGLKRSVVVVATGDQPPLLRVRAGLLANAVAEFFRDQGLDVVLMMDSLTRLAWAQREIGLAGGEPPATKGYPPSVFAIMPRILERAGLASRGSITGFYAVLVDADDINEPIGDTARGILDGHVWLSRRLAQRGQYPSVDPLVSISRVMKDVVDEQHRGAALYLKQLLAAFAEMEDLINIGAYVEGSNQEVDVARAMMPKIREFLCQSVSVGSDVTQARGQLVELVHECRTLGQTQSQARNGASPGGSRPDPKDRK